MCETMQSSHRLRPVMALVRVLLPPSGAQKGSPAPSPDAVPPSPHFSGGCPEKT
jgi:hypothetical protein